MAPREGYELIEDRLVSGLGVLQIPQDDTYRAFRIWVDVVRLPNPDFFNGKWNPSRSEYAKITYMVGKYVWKEEILRYLHQVYDYFPKEPGAFLAPYLVCSLENIQSIACQILAGGGWGVCVPGDLLYAEPVRYEVNFIRFACREETALQVRLYGLKEDVGCTNATPNPKRNVEPSAPLPIVPSGDAIEVSEPYAFPDDDGNTIPYQGDLLPPPPPEACVFTTVTCSFKFSFNANTFTSVKSGNSPARIVVTNNINNGNIVFESSTCNGSTLIEEYNVVSSINSGSRSDGTTPYYDFVTSDNPDVPVVFL